MRVVDGRAEERSDLYCYGTHARYLYIKSVTLGGTVQLWQWCHLCVIYDRCLLIQCMWLMQPLSGAIQYMMDQSQIDPVYWLMGRMLGLLMSDSQWPVRPIIGLQFNKHSSSFHDWAIVAIPNWFPVELEANYRSYGSPAIAHKRAEHSAHKLIDRINLRLVHHELYCAT